MGTTPEDWQRLRSILKNCDVPVTVWETPQVSLPSNPAVLDLPSRNWGEGRLQEEDQAWKKWCEQYNSRNWEKDRLHKEEPRIDDPSYLQQVQKNKSLLRKILDAISLILIIFGLWLVLIPFAVLGVTLYQKFEPTIILPSLFALLISSMPYLIGKKILSSLHEKDEVAKSALWKKHHDIWLGYKQNFLAEHKQRLRDFEAEHERRLRDWEAEKDKIEECHKQAASIHQQLMENYLSCNPATISVYVSSAVDKNHIQLGFNDRGSEVEYHPENKMAIIDCPLPSPADMPNVKEMRYIKTRAEFKAIPFSAKERNELYDAVIYQICLSDINQIFLTDQINGIESVVYNGWVNSLDKSTGNTVNACILSLQVSKERLQQINLKNVDPKECFRGLRGVGSAQLHGITPIPPIMRINTEDSRFIESYDVAHTLDEGTNLAAMDWQDFEHLIREAFSKVFSSDGMEVKVTQSSRDRGVDAIAFDPDPVRGGKIVIQAKRYTNVVGVSAVRDLYGTMMNEGAMKGILVTTSHFGNDAYEFVKGKPLTLISGGELLSLLAKQGHKANIDLSEAKKLLAREGSSRTPDLE